MSLSREDKATVLLRIRKELTAVILSSISIASSKSGQKVEHFEELLDASVPFVTRYNDLIDFQGIPELGQKREGIKKLIEQYAMGVAEGLSLSKEGAFHLFIKKATVICSATGLKKIFNALVDVEYPNLALVDQIPESENNFLLKSIHAMEVVMRLPANDLTELKGIRESKQSLWVLVEAYINAPEMKDKPKPQAAKTTAFSGNTGTHFKPAPKPAPAAASFLDMEKMQKFIRQDMPKHVSYMILYNEASENPLMSAIASKASVAEIARIILGKPALVLSRDMDMNNPVHLAVAVKRDETEQTQLINLLHRHGADINGQNKYGVPPSHLAIMMHMSKALEALLTLSPELHEATYRM